MSEFITLQVGQCGNQIGSSFWKYALQEYDISLPRESNLKPHKQIIKKQLLGDAFESFFWCPKSVPTSQSVTFSDLVQRKVKARAICIDMEDSVVARFRKGPLRDIFDDTCLITNYPGSGNNWAEGYFSHGTEYLDIISNKIRKASERCDRLHGFLMVYSLGGGTGSGLGSRILALLEDQYPHIDRLATCVFPAGNNDVITAPYNVALATCKLLEHASCVFPVDNRALTDICSQIKLREINDKGNKKYFQDLNEVIVSMMLHVTSGSRFSGSLNVDLNEIATNMVPFPGMHFLCSSLSPLSCVSMKPPPPRSLTRVDDIFSSAWSRTNQLLKIDPLKGVLLGTTFIARGNVSLADMRRNVEKFQKKGKFSSWNREAMKVGLCSVPPPGHDISVLNLFNTSAMSTLFEDVKTQFHKLFHRHAHVHHYLQVNGFEMDCFTDALDQMENAAASYSEMGTYNPFIPQRLQVL